MRIRPIHVVTRFLWFLRSRTRVRPTTSRIYLPTRFVYRADGWPAIDNGDAIARWDDMTAPPGREPTLRIESNKRRTIHFQSSQLLRSGRND